MLKNTKALKKPTPTKLLSNRDILIGPSIPKTDRVKLMDDVTFEEFVEEWAFSHLQKSGDYQSVLRHGGAGDMGRDVIGIIDEKKEIWDNYQCKHYKNPLTPTNIWIELGKLCYYTFTKEFSIPKNYYFVSPKGVGSKLSRLLKNPMQLKAGLIQNWDQNCKTNKITSAKEIELTPDLLSHINSINFNLFKEKNILEIIEEHSKTLWHAGRFGGGLQISRPTPKRPSIKISKIELKYIKQLLKVYSDSLGKVIKNATELSKHTELDTHFFRQREYFYSAESLKEFERDHVPPGNNDFESLKEEIFTSVINIVESSHKNSLEKLRETLQESMKTQITNYVLVHELKPQDRCGICHHLVNENKMSWI